jgi:hypothetical protein
MREAKASASDKGMSFDAITVVDAKTNNSITDSMAHLQPGNIENCRIITFRPNNN